MKVARFPPPPLQTDPSGQRNKGFPCLQPFPEGRELDRAALALPPVVDP